MYHRFWFFKTWIFETKDIQTFNLWLENDTNSFLSVEYLTETKFKYSSTCESLPMFSIHQNVPGLHYSSSTTSLLHWSTRELSSFFGPESTHDRTSKTLPRIAENWHESGWWRSQLKLRFSILDDNEVAYFDNNAPANAVQESIDSSFMTADSFGTALDVWPQMRIGLLTVSYNCLRSLCGKGTQLSGLFSLWQCFDKECPDIRCECPSPLSHSPPSRKKTISSWRKSSSAL